MTINHSLYKIKWNMSHSLNQKSASLKKTFGSLSISERYDLIISMGKSLPDYPKELKTSDKIVPGCQSILYLDGQLASGKLTFLAHGDALISLGLAALLISLYSGESPETILTCPPTVIQELGIASSLSLTRSNGFLHIHLRMKQIALQTLTSKKSK